MLKFFLVFVLSRQVLAAEVPDPIQYNTLSHTIILESLRAGSHDPSGNNNYLLKVEMTSLLNSAEERNLDPQKKKKKVVDLGAFGETTLPSLSRWDYDEKNPNAKSLKIDGDKIRELVAQTMQELKVEEDGIMVQVVIKLFVKQKKHYVLSEDVLIGETNYFPIPATKFDTPLRVNQKLTITDPKAALVKFQIKYGDTAPDAKKP